MSRGMDPYHLYPDRSDYRGRSGVVRIPARAREQIFLSGSSAFRRQWSVAGGDDGEEDAAENLKPLRHRGKEAAEEKSLPRIYADERG